MSIKTGKNIVDRISSGEPRMTHCRLFFVLLGLMIAAGCSSTIELMPTPNLYANCHVDPFPHVPRALQNNHADVLYFTDRTAARKTPGGSEYGFGRSRSIAFGISRVEFGKDISWEELKKASRTSERSVDLAVTVPKRTELVRFPETPRLLIHILGATTEPVSDEAMLGDDDEPDELADEDVVRREIAAQLAVTPSKEVFLFIHGYNNNFDDSVETIAQLWHFLGRQGVPIAYSWPAGSPGLLQGYTYDRESSEFTVYHLKQVIRLIASCPDVKKLHIICHSRGTDTTLSALRELHMEIHGSRRSTREVLKLGTVVMAAPDIDMDVVVQKLTSARLGRVPEHFAIYVCARDNALGISNWLFSGIRRLGQLNAELFTPEELTVMRASKTMQIIDAQVSDPGDFGHNYFHSNPAVSSDLILLLRYDLTPGPENGRPLRVEKKGFWEVDDNYPGNVAPPQIRDQAY